MPTLFMILLRHDIRVERQGGDQAQSFEATGPNKALILRECATCSLLNLKGALSHGARTVCARCAHGSMFLGWLPNLYPVEWPP